MRYEMTTEDATNVVNVLSDDLACDPNEDVRQLATAARRLVNHIAEQSTELERERARRHGLGCEDARRSDGHRLRAGTDGGGRRDFLADRGVHAGETLYLLTYAGWHAVRYESNMPRNEPVLYLPLPGVRQDVLFCVPREALFAWPEELRHR
jgi:hypothetical protein